MFLDHRPETLSAAQNGLDHRLAEGAEEKILLPTDFSKASQLAIRAFLNEMSCFSGELILFNSFPPPGAVYETGYLGMPVYLPENYWTELKSWTDQESEKLCKAIQAQGFRCRVIISNGVFNPPEAIQKCADSENVSLIVMASVSRGLDLAILGSVTRETFRLRKWPVWVYGPEAVGRLNQLG